MAEPTLAELLAEEHGDPHDPLNGYLPRPAYRGPVYLGPRLDEETGLRGFQQGIGVPVDKAGHPIYPYGPPQQSQPKHVSADPSPNDPTVTTNARPWTPPHGMRPEAVAKYAARHAPAGDTTDPARPISAAEAQKYGATPADVAAIQRGHAPVPLSEREAENDEWQRKNNPVQWGLKHPGEVTPVAATPAGIKHATGAGAGATDAGNGEPPQITWGGGGGAAQTIKAHEVPLTAPARQAEMKAAVEEQKAGGAEASAANEETERQRAIGTHDVAKAYEDAGVDAKLRAQTAADESKAYRKHIDEFASHLAETKIDPDRRWNNASTGQKIQWKVASMFGAIGQGLLHLSTNQIADAIENDVQKDIAAQKANYEIGEKRLVNMNSLYAHAMQATNSKEEAERVAVGYGLEAAKQSALAMTQGTASAKALADGKIAAGVFDEKIAANGINENKWLQEQRVGGGGMSPEKIADLARKRVEQQETLGHPTTLDDAKRWVIESMVPGTVGAGSAIGGGKETSGKDKKDAQASIDEVNHGYDNLLKSPMLDKLGFLPWVAKAGGFKRLMPESTAILPQITKFNLQMDSYAGKLLKDNEGRLPPVIADELHKFHIEADDLPDLARAKVANSREYVNSLARTGGTKAPEPNVTAPTFEK